MKMRIEFSPTVAFLANICFVEASFSFATSRCAAQAELQNRLASLVQQQSQQFSAQRQAQIQDIRMHLNLEEVEHMSTDLRMLFEVVGTSTNPAGIQNTGVVDQN
jgi:hypothetical protein